MTKNNTSFANEARFAIEPFRLAMNSPKLMRRAHRPSSIIVLPGLGGNDLSTGPLRWYLQRIGHDVTGWNLGVHRPQMTLTLTRFIDVLEQRAAVSQTPIVLVGWSLGGVIAREAARGRSRIVEQVITFGAPINAFGRRTPIGVPVTSVYSRRDSVVDWRQAVDTHNASTVNVEVHSSHLGLGIDPDVWRIIADAIDVHPRRVESSPSRR